MFSIYAVQEDADFGCSKNLQNISNSLPTNKIFINIDQLENDVHST
jgi:hypothetical protein